MAEPTPYTQTETVDTASYSFDVPTTPAVESAQVIRKITTLYGPDAAPTAITRYQITMTSPFYLSVDCLESELPAAIATIQYVLDSPPV